MVFVIVLHGPSLDALKVPDGLRNGPSVDLGGEDELVALSGLQPVEAERVLARAVERGLLVELGGEQVQLLARHPRVVLVVEDGLDGGLSLGGDLHGILQNVALLKRPVKENKGLLKSL